MIIALIGSKFLQRLNIGVDLIGNKWLERITKKVSEKLVKENLRDFNRKGIHFLFRKYCFVIYLVKVACFVSRYLEC